MCHPSFEVIRPLLSRCAVYVLKSLDRDDLLTLLDRALHEDVILRDRQIEVREHEALLRYSGGDARKLLGILDLMVTAAPANAPIIIDNSTIGGEIHSMEELLEKSPLLAQFRAVQNGNVWCTGKNMYQETTQLGQMIQSFRKIFSGEADNLTELPFLYRLG